MSTLPVVPHSERYDFTYQYVADGITHAQSREDQVFAEGEAVLNDMLDLVGTLSTIPTISAELGTVETTVSAYVPPDLPVEPAMTTNFPSAPAAAVTGSVGTIALSDAPVFTATEPAISTFAPPSAFTETVPVEPALNDPVYPDTPASTLPTAPTARELILPTAPALIAVSFDGVIPTRLAAPPGATFNYSNAAYQSDLTDALKTQLLSLVNNARQTGLLPAIEDQIWNRARERTASQGKRLLAAVSRQTAAMGWNMPQGDEALALQRATDEAVKLDVTESRAIAIAQAELEQKNFQFSIQTAIGLEGQLINLHNAEQQRLFEAARYTIEAAIQLYGMEVAYFNANVSLYDTQARVYADRLRAQLNEVEIFKAQLEGQKLIGDMNAQDVALYQAKIGAIVSTYELYKAQLSGVKLHLEGDALKLQRFESTVRAFAEKVRAKSLENDIYKTQQDGEKIKVDLYSGLTQAFRSRMEGFKIETDAKVAKQDSDIKIAYDVPLKVAEQNTEIFKSMIQAESEKLKALSSLFETRGRVYESQTKGQAARVDAEVQIQKNEIDKLVAEANIRLEAMKGNVSTLLAEKEMLLGIQKAIAQIKAQLTAAYGSAINYGASISSGNNYGDSHNTSHNYSLSESL